MTKTQLIAITRHDGGLSIMQFVLEQPARGGEPGWTREALPEVVEQEIQRARIDAVRWRFITPSELPASREHRNRWRDDGHQIYIAPEDK